MKGFLIALVILLVMSAVPVWADQPPQCPPGYIWDAVTQQCVKVNQDGGSGGTTPQPPAPPQPPDNDPKPGNGYGDKNHEHDGPPGQNK